MKILIAEENKQLLATVTGHFKQRHFIVDSVTNARMLTEMLRQVKYDAVIVDFALHGAQLFGEWKNSLNSHTPCIIISARHDLSVRVTALNAGADDYIIKPFDLLELEARLFAVLRRSPSSTPHTVCHGDICFDLKSRYLKIDGKVFTLSRRESMLLAEMLRAAPGLVTKGQLESRLYSFEENASPNAIEALVSRLRRKLSKIGTNCRIETAHGLGYRLVHD